jgi:hypothetical protein
MLSWKTEVFQTTISILGGIETIDMLDPPFIDVAILAVLQAIWMAPDWGFKVLALAEAIRRFRS